MGFIKDMTRKYYQDRIITLSGRRDSLPISDPERNEIQDEIDAIDEYLKSPPQYNAWGRFLKTLKGGLPAWVDAAIEQHASRQLRKRLPLKVPDYQIYRLPEKDLQLTEGETHIATIQGNCTAFMMYMSDGFGGEKLPRNDDGIPRIICEYQYILTDTRIIFDLVSKRPYPGELYPADNGISPILEGTFEFRSSQILFNGLQPAIVNWKDIGNTLAFRSSCFLFLRIGESRVLYLPCTESHYEKYFKHLFPKILGWQVTEYE